MKASLENAALEGWVESPFGGGNRNREYLLGIVKALRAKKRHRGTKAQRDKGSRQS